MIKSMHDAYLALTQHLSTSKILRLRRVTLLWSNSS